MTREEFKDKGRLATEFFNEHFKGEDGLAFVLLLDARDEENKLRFNDIISNIHQSGIISFIRDIIKLAASIIARQN